MIQNLTKIIHSKYGKYVISGLLGLGLACLFRKVCKDRECIVFKAPNIDEVIENIYKHDNKCLKLKKKSQSCGHSNKQVLV